MSSKVDSTMESQDRPKRLAAQRAKVYLNDNLDWNEERALQKALEASLVDEAARISVLRRNDLDDNSCTGGECSSTDSESEMSPRQTNGHLSMNRTRQSQRHFSPKTSSGQAKNNRNSQKNRPTTSRTYGKDQTVKNNVRMTNSKQTSNMDTKKNRKSIIDGKMSIRGSIDSDCSNGSDGNHFENTCNCHDDDEMSIDVDQSCSDGRKSNLTNGHQYDSQSGSNTYSNEEDQNKPKIKYLDNISIRRTVAAQRKFAINSIVYKLANQKLSNDDQEDKYNTNNQNDSQQTSIGENFEFFPNKLINCGDFITWMCHTDIDDILKCNTFIEFPCTYRFKDIYPYDYAIGKYRNVNDSNDEENDIKPHSNQDKLPTANNVNVKSSNAKSLNRVTTKQELSDSSSDQHDDEEEEEKILESCIRSPAIRPAINRKNMTIKKECGSVIRCSLRTNGNSNTITSPNNAITTLTRTRLSMRNNAKLNEIPMDGNDISETTGIKPKNRRAKPVVIVDYLSDDSDEIDQQEESDEPILEPRITRSNKNKQQQTEVIGTASVNNKTDRAKVVTNCVTSKRNAEEIRKRALQYEADFRQSMKDIENKYHSKRCDRNNNTDHQVTKQGLKRPQYTSISSSSSSLDDSDLDDDDDDNKRGLIESSGLRSEDGQANNALRTVHSLRRIKTLRKAVLSKTTNVTKNYEKNQSSKWMKRCSTRMSSSNPPMVMSSTSSTTTNTTFDIRTRASMRRTRQSKFQHQNRNKNNFLFQQYDGNRPLTVGSSHLTIDAMTIASASNTVAATRPSNMP